jgi:hypothetical protein
MTSFGRGILLACLSTAAACDPVAGVRLQQSLSPAPTPECVREALARSPFVLRAETAEARAPAYAFTLFLQDSLGLSTISPRLDISPTRDTAQLSFFLGYFHRFSLSDSTVHRLTAVATPIVRRVQDVCVPASRAPLSCAYSGLRGGRSCEVAG